MDAVSSFVTRLAKVRPPQRKTGRSTSAEPLIFKVLLSASGPGDRVSGLVVSPVIIASLWPEAQQRQQGQTFDSGGRWSWRPAPRGPGFGAPSPPKMGIASTAVSRLLVTRSSSKGLSVSRRALITGPAVMARHSAG